MAQPESKIGKNLLEFFLNSTTLVAFGDRNGSFTLLSPAWEKLLGHKRDLLISKPATEFIFEPDRPKFELLLASVNQQGFAKPIQVRFVASTGALVWLRLGASVSEDVQTVYYNVTEIGEFVKEQPAESGGGEGGTSGDTDMALFYVSPEGLVEMWSEGAHALFGFSPEEVMGRHFGEVLDPTHAAGRGIGPKFKEAMRTGVCEVAEPRMRKDGSTFKAHTIITPRYAADGKLVGFAQIVRDPRRRIEDEQRLALLETVIINAQLGFIITQSSPLEEPGPAIIYVNPEFTRQTGYEFEEACGRSPRFLFGKHTDGDALQRLEAAMSAGQEVTVELVVYRKDGSEYLMETSLHPNLDESGGVTHFIIIHRDVTQRRKLQDELLGSQKLRALGEITSGIAHEFNNLLAPMLMQVEQVLEARTNDTELAEQLGRVCKAINQARNLTSRILSHSRVRSNVREEAALTATVERTLKLIKATFDPRIEVVVQVPPDLAPLTTYHSLLMEALINLCLNARDTLLEKLAGSPPEDWKPRITISGEQGLYIPPDSLDGQGIECQCVAVSDNGLGMSKENVNRIFEPFFTTKGAGKGTGLGLSLVWRVTQELGGWIDVESTVGEGTTFFVFVPVHAAAAPQPETAPPAAEETPPLATDTRILLVEDNKALARSINLFMSKKGMKVTECEHGLQAAALLQKDPSLFDVIITDMNMPEMNGEELLDLCHQIGYSGKILLISGYLSDEKQEELLKKGAHSVLIKPFTPEELMRQMGGVMAL